MKRACDRVDWLDHQEYGAYTQAIKDRHIEDMKTLALKEGVKETDAASSRPWWDVEVSRETCEAVVAWLIEQKIISSDRPWKKGGIALKKEVYAQVIGLEGFHSQTRERYKALAEIGATLNSLEKYHADGHMADGLIKVLGEQMEEQLHTALTHRLSSTVGKTLDMAATIGLDVCVREYDKAVEAQTRATLDELSKRKRLFKLPDRTPVQPWEMDRIADEPVYVPLYKRYPPYGGEGVPNSGSGLMKPEYQWLTTMSGSHPTPKPSTKPAVASGKASQYVDSKTLDSTAAVKSLTPAAATRELADSRVHLNQILKQPLDSEKFAKKHERATDLLIPPVVGSVGTVPMSGFSPALAVPALGNPVTAAGAAGLAVMLGMDYQTQRREVEMAYEGWRKGDASLLPDIVWSQPAAREMMERQMGYPFGRPELLRQSLVKLESPLPTRAPQACGGIEIPRQEKPKPIVTPVSVGTRPPPVLVTPMPEQLRLHPFVTPIHTDPVRRTEGFDIHRPSLDDLIKYKKRDGVYEQPKAHPAPKDGLPAFPEAKAAPRKTNTLGGGLRYRWKDKDNIYEWDAQHGKVEKYDKRGKHQGEFDPNTGEQTKPKDPTRRIEL